jgi:hypothetical protein
MLNIEGKENFIIRNSLFDIRYSKSVIVTSDQEPETWLLAAHLCSSNHILPVSAVF